MATIPLRQHHCLALQTKEGALWRLAALSGEQASRSLAIQLALSRWHSASFVAICEEELSTVRRCEADSSRDLQTQIDELCSGALYGPYPIEAPENTLVSLLS